MIRKIIKDINLIKYSLCLCDAFLSEILTAMMIALHASVIQLSHTSRHRTDEPRMNMVFLAILAFKIHSGISIPTTSCF